MDIPKQTRNRLLMARPRHLVTVMLACFTVSFLAACGALEVGIEPTATPEHAAAARPADSATIEANRATSMGAAGSSIDAASAAKPTPTSLLDRGRFSYNDPVLGLSLDIPLWWQTQAAPGAAIRFFERGNMGATQAVLILSALSPESNSLESALAEVTQGVWGAHILDVRPVPLGMFEALRLELDPSADRPRVAWLVVAPSGRALNIHTDVDPALIELVIEVVLATLRPLDSVASQAAPDPDQTLTPMLTLTRPSPTVAPTLALSPARDSTPSGVDLPMSLYLLPGELARSERPRSVWRLVPGGATVERITPPDLDITSFDVWLGDGRIATVQGTDNCTWCCPSRNRVCSLTQIARPMATPRFPAWLGSQRGHAWPTVCKTLALAPASSPPVYGS